MKRLPIILFISALLVIPSWAQEGPATPPRANELGAVCQEQIVPFLNAEESAFLRNINQHFQNRADNSNLIGRAIELFTAYRKKLYARLQTYNRPRPEQPIVEETRQIRECEALVTARLDLAKEVLRRHIIGTAQAKKTTRLMEKYKVINKKLRKLNEDVGALKGYFDALKAMGSKDCFYLSSCVGR